MKLTEKQLNKVIKEAVRRTFDRLMEEHRNKFSKFDILFDGKEMDAIRERMEKCGWELAYMYKLDPENKEVTYFGTPADGEKAKSEWAVCVGRFGEYFGGQTVKQGSVKKEVIDPKAKKSKKYNPAADEMKERTGTHYFTLKRDDLDWDYLTSPYN